MVLKNPYPCYSEDMEINRYPYPTNKGKNKMATKSTKSAPIVISAPKIVNAWAKVCATSAKSENEIIASIENLSAVLVLESGLSVRDMQKVIADTGEVSSFVKISHVSALPTWSKLRAKHADFKALPLAKQLSTAKSSYDILGSGKGEGYKSLEILTKEIATVRKANQENREENKGSTPTPAKAKKNALAEMLAYFTALDVSALSEQDKGALAEIQFVIEDKMANA
jgi:hypothetical protein